MDVTDDYSFVRSHSSNARNLYLECYALLNYSKKYKIVNNPRNLKWCLLVNRHDHLGIMKSTPSRKNGSSVKGIRGEALGHIENLLKCHYTGVVTIDNELVRINQNDTTESWSVPTTTKIKSF